MPGSNPNPVTSEVVTGTPVTALPVKSWRLYDKGQFLCNLIRQDANSSHAYHFDMLDWLRDGEFLIAARAVIKPTGAEASVVYSRAQVQLAMAPSLAGQTFAVMLSVKTSAGRFKQMAIIVEQLDQMPFSELEPNAATNVVPAPALIQAASVIFDPDTGTVIVPETPPRPALILSTMGLSFPSTIVGTTSSSMAVTMSNAGLGVLNIDAVGMLGDFQIEGIYPSTLEPGASANLSLVFKPSALGSRSGSLTIATNDIGSPAVVSLSGEGMDIPGELPVVSVSPTSLVFPETTVGQPAAARTVTLTNVGGAVLVISNISTFGDFSVGVYPSSLAPGASTVLSVGFTPSAQGDRTATLSIASNAPDSPRIVPLSGVGAVHAGSPAVSLSPASLTFPLTDVGIPASAQSITLTNTGDAVLTIAGISASGDFSVGSHPATLAAGASTVLAVSFTPTIAGSRSGMLSISSNAAGSPHTAALAGQGRGAPSEITWLTADGALLRDEAGQQVMLRSINWFGFEQIFLPQGLWSNPYKTLTVGGTVREGLMDLCARLGFNSMRITVSQDVTWTGSKPVTSGSAWNRTYVDPDFNPDLFTDLTNPWSQPQPVLTSIEIMDRIVAHARTLGMRIVLDLHCLAPNNDNIAGTGGKWYTTATPSSPGSTTGARGEPRNEAQAIAALVFLADRYKDEPTVCGIDLINEPHNCTWDEDPLTGVVGFYERAGAAIQAANPNIMLVCEGITGDIQFGEPGDPTTIWGTIWAGKLDEARARPVVMPLPHKVIYSPHEYGSYIPGISGAAHQWFDQPTYPTNMPEVWRRQWGYLAQENIAPVWIGEFGSWVKAGTTPNYTAQHEAWDADWLAYLADYCNTYSIGFAYWTLNPEGEPNGLLSMVGEAWSVPYPYKLTVLEPFLNPAGPTLFF